MVIHDGSSRQVFSLNRSYYGLYLPKGIWRHVENFSTNSVALVLSSTHYDPEDYIRNFEEYEQWLKERKK